MDKTTPNRMTHKIEIVPDGKHLKINAGSSIASVLREAGVELLYPCGNSGSCGKCKVQFESGAPPPRDEERSYFPPRLLKQGWRLACQNIITSSSRIRIPEESRLCSIVALTDALRIESALIPSIQKKIFVIDRPALDNLKSDEYLIEKALRSDPEKDQFESTLYFLQKAPVALRANDFKVTVVSDHHRLIDIEPGDTTQQSYGLAVDLGTTTVVASLIDLQHGRTIGVEAMLNPQTDFGDDLISRVQAIAEDADNLYKMHNQIISGVNDLVHKLSINRDVHPNHIYTMVSAGNTVMQQIFHGVNPVHVAAAPYTPTFHKHRHEYADRLKINICPAAYIHSLPHIGGFVGGDIAADLLAAGFAHSANATRLLIDIGTNCELVLEHHGRRVAASAPAGPALEGARIDCGLRAETGAISDMRFDGQGWQIHTIGNAPARGICGSGLLHLIAAFFQAGIITADGQIQGKYFFESKQYTEFWKNRIRKNDAGLNEIVIATRAAGAWRDVILSQKDIREFQLAKAAICAACTILCRELDCALVDIEQVFIAGAFGNFIRPAALISLGLTPIDDIDRLHFIGNGALEGARLALINTENWQKITDLVGNTEFIELGGHPDFQNIFVDQLQIGRIV